MSLIKIASANDWSALADRPPVEVKVSSRGLGASDSRKLASEVGDQFISEVRKIEDQLDSNHKYAHVISCGCTELFGPNRNADGWGKSALARDMPTYLKHAKCFRDHDNRTTSNYYGRPKVAFFDEDRGYGRLLVAFHANEAACTDKLAKVADREIEELLRKGEVKVSHGTKISHDTCSMCGNNAKTRADYCDSTEFGGKCSMFGCRSGLSKIAEDGRIQFVHNDDKNLFYDISSIGMSKNSARQADRVAYATLYETLDKTAAEQFGDAVPGSAWLAEQMGLGARYDLFDRSQLSPWQQKYASAAIELASMSPADPRTLFNDYGADVAGLWQLRAHSEAKSAAVTELARRCEFIGPQVFAKICGADEQTAKHVEAYAYGGLQRLAADDQIVDMIKTASYTDTFELSDRLLLQPISIPQGSVKADSISRSSKFASLQGDYRPEVVASDPEAGAIALEYLSLKVAYASRIWEEGENEIGFLA